MAIFFIQTPAILSLLTCYVAIPVYNLGDLGNCDFENDTCGWIIHEPMVWPGSAKAVCGFGGDLNSCFPLYIFQDGALWNRQQIRKSSTNEETVVLVTQSFIQTPDRRQTSDVISPVIPLSMDHRCLRYSHLVYGRSALVVAYITDFFEPYAISHYLNAHGNSTLLPEIPESSVNLPTGIEFKIVFRALHESGIGFVFLDNIFITSGLCETCSPHEFRCNKARIECIPMNKVCDLEPDCLEKEDEINCDSEAVKSFCNQTLNSTVANSRLLNEDSREGDNGENIFFQDHSNLCATDYCCPFLPHMNTSVPSSGIDCISSGLSFTCTSANVPFYATSLTVFGLVQDALVFNESFVNLKEIKIIECTLRVLHIYSEVMIQTLTINNSSIKIAAIYNENKYLRNVRIINSTFADVIFSSNVVHSFDLFVHNSTLRNPRRYLVIRSVNVNLSESIGFPDMVLYYLYVTTVNLSSCSLNVHPKSNYYTITLDLSQNNLSTWFYSSLIQKLHLQNNLIVAINFTMDLRHSEARLQYLDLSNNFITFINEYDFFNIPNLLHLDIRNNRIADIHENAFSFISKLRLLDLSHNYLRSLGHRHFILLSNLQYLYIQNNNIKVVDGMFDGLMNIEHLQVDSYTLCCAQPKTTNRIQCTAPRSEISSCNNLIDIPLLSTLIWYMALLAILGNLIGPVYKGLKSPNRSSFIMFSINLGVADLLMGIYLFIIAGANLNFSGRYGLEDELWRHSYLCTIAGVLATLSTEASVLFILLITVDRILTILYPFSRLRKGNWFSKFISIVMWTISFMLSMLPLFGNEYFNGYYSSSGICISLPLSIQRKPGWEYSMILFVGANFVIFFAILSGQLFIFVNLLRVGKQMDSSNASQQRKEINLAKTLVVIAVTDMFCWIPIGVIGLLTFTGIDVTSEVYAWVIVIILPIHSALNPIIYTFSEILRQQRQKYQKETSREQKTSTPMTSKA